MSEHLVQPWQKNGDEQAAEALYQAHHRRIYRLAHALLGEADGAEQVMQETMIYALTNIHLFDSQRTSFPAWLHTITVGRCRERQRRDPAGSGPEATFAFQEHQKGIRQALKQLSPQLREAVVLRYWSGHTYEEIAQILRCPLPTAHSRVRLAYEQLHKLLNAEGKPVMGGEPCDE
jgi:RNA polymerase sigma-70 factor (ECF subfamily)